MENYILRIYRFEKDNPRHLVGIVESVEGDRREKRAFTNLEDLWEILSSHASEADIINRATHEAHIQASEPATPTDVKKGLRTKSDY